MDLVQAERRHEGERLPVPVRGMCAKSFPSVTPAPKRGHVGLNPGFVDEDEPGGIDPALIFPPLLPSPLNAGAILLGGEHGFF